MKVLQIADLRPGKTMWLEDNGLAFKEMRLLKVTVLFMVGGYAYFFPFIKLPLATYDRGLTWRCWDEEPDIDTVCNTEWAAA